MLVNRYVSPAARAGATAIAAATGLMVLASTGQTPSGFVPASFGGPLGLFDSSSVSAMNDVVSIGDGPADANELATLLKTAGPLPSAASTPLQATFTPGAVPNTAGLSVTPAPNGTASAATDKQSLPVKPVLDSQGRVDCSKAISCQTDPNTNVTTVTYPDGVVAFVQQINDMTVVAYKTVGQAIQDGIEALLPKAPAPLPAAAAPAPVQVPAPAPVPVVTAPAPNPVPVKTPEIDARQEPSPVEAGPVAPSAPAAPDISASTVRPQLTISNPPLDFEDKIGSTGGAAGNPGAALGAVKDAVGSVVDAVTGAVGKAIGPGAVTEKPESASESTSSDSDRKSSSDSGS